MKTHRTTHYKQYHHEDNAQRDKPLFFENYYKGDIINEHEQQRIPDDVSEHALRFILGDAILRYSEQGWVSYSLNSNKYIGASRYGGPYFRREKVKTATEYAESLGFIQIDAGESWSKGGCGKQSRFRALRPLISKAGFEPAIVRVPREIIRLKNEAGALIGYKDDEKTLALRRDLQEWNHIIDAHHIWIDSSHLDWKDIGVIKIVSPKNPELQFFIRPDSTRMHRVFNCGSFDLGGRAFGPFWQSLPKLIRKDLRIEENATASGDYSCSHLRLAYAEDGLDPGIDDGYAIAGYDDPDGRSLVKFATNIAINCKDENQARRAVSDRIAWKERGRLGPQRGNTNYKDATKVLEAILAKHSRIEKAFFSGSGLRFMAKEAMILADVARAARNQGIVTLPVHDELIADVRHIEKVKELMVGKWSETIPICPIVR